MTFKKKQIWFKSLLLINILSIRFGDTKSYNNSPPIQTETGSNIFIDTISETVAEKPTTTYKSFTTTECKTYSFDYAGCSENGGHVVMKTNGPCSSPVCEPTETSSDIKPTPFECDSDEEDPNWCLDQGLTVVYGYDENGCFHMTCKNLPFSSDGRCGLEMGIRCPPGQCCSKDGKCGNSRSHCSMEEGCQDLSGDCGENYISTTITTASCSTGGIPPPICTSLGKKSVEKSINAAFI